MKCHLIIISKRQIIFVKYPDNEANVGKKYDNETGYPRLVNQPSF